MQLYIFILRHFTCFKLSMIASTQTMSRKQNSGRPSWNFYKVFGQRKCQSVQEIFKYSLIRFVQSFISLRTSYHTSNMRLNLLDRPIKKNVLELIRDTLVKSHKVKTPLGESNPQDISPKVNSTITCPDENAS